MNRRDFDLIAKRYGPNALNGGTWTLRLHREREPLSITNNGCIEMGYRVVALELSSRYVGGFALGVCRTRTRPTKAERAEWRRRARHQTRKVQHAFVPMTYEP